jgi:hypothetical protein
VSVYEGAVRFFFFSVSCKTAVARAIYLFIDVVGPRFAIQIAIRHTVFLAVLRTHTHTHERIRCKSQQFFLQTKQLAVAQAVSRRPVTLQAQCNFRPVLVAKRSGTQTGCSPSTSIFSCEYHSSLTNAICTVIALKSATEWIAYGKQQISIFIQDWNSRHLV